MHAVSAAMLALLACVAGLLDAPTPPPPAVITMSPERIEQIPASRVRPAAVTINRGPVPIVIVPPNVSRALLGHEFAHVVQIAEGKRLSEREADWVQRQVDVWCPEDNPN